MRWAERVARMGDGRDAYHGLVGKSLGNRPLRRPRLRWVGCIKMELNKTGWEEVGWSDLTQMTDKWRAVVNTEMNLPFPQNARNFLPSFTRTLIHCVSYFTLPAVIRHFSRFVSFTNINRYSPISEPKWSCLCMAGALPTPTQRSWQWWWAGPRIRTEWASVKEKQCMHSGGKKSLKFSGLSLPS